jgi:hypothetical protein
MIKTLDLHLHVPSLAIQIMGNEKKEEDAE